MSHGNSSVISRLWYYRNTNLYQLICLNTMLYQNGYMLSLNLVC